MVIGWELYRWLNPMIRSASFMNSVLDASSAFLRYLMATGCSSYVHGDE